VACPRGAKRVALMDDWAAYLAQPAAQVVPLQSGRQEPISPPGVRSA
jgi:hypothetical protein